MIKMAAETPQTDIAYYARRRHDIIKNKIFKSESESDVRHHVLSLYDLDLIGNLEKNRIDFWSDNIIIEFKHNVDLRNMNVRCKVLSQILHYLYLMPTKYGNFNLPDTICLADKTNFIFYDTRDFIKYLFRDTYFTSVTRPSGDHPDLEKILRRDRNVKGSIFHTIADYSSIWSELEKRGVYQGA